LGEIARSISRKRADVPIWLALGAGLTPLVALRPLIHSATSNIFARPLYSPNFFAKPGFTAMLATYSELVAPAVPVLLAGLVIVALLMARSANPGELEVPAECRLSAHELLAAAGFAALPLAITIFTKLFTGFYVTRYTLATVVGLAILFGFVAARFLRTPGWGMLLAIVVGGGFLVVQGWWLVEPLLPATGDPGKAPITAAMDDRPLPIVVANPYVFMQLAYYGPPELRPRLVYLSEPAVVMNRGDFVPELALRWLRHWAPVRVEEYRSFVATHPRFWVYFSSIGRMEWLPSQLMKDGGRLELRAENNGLELFEASAGAVK